MAHSHPGVDTIDTAAYRSGLRQVNPGLKTGLALAVLVIVLAADSLWVSGAVTVSMACISVWAGGVTLRQYLRLLSLPAVFILLGSLAVACQWGAAAAGVFWIELPWFFLYVTRLSLAQALHAAARAFGGVSALYFLTLHTPVAQLLALLCRWHCPQLVTELMYLIYRYLFMLLDAQEQMQAAAKSRSGYRNFRVSCRTFGKVLGNLLFLSLRKAEQCYDAMESRGYQGKLRFLEEEQPVCRRQALAAALYLAALLVIWAAAGWRGSLLL